MLHFNTKEIPITDAHKLLLGGIGPRPIALVSTLSEDGVPNLSPFSFFNVFGYNPPVIIFSPSRRGRDASLKDTYHNLLATKECVVQSVTYSMVEQINLASTEYSSEVDEFKKSGLTPIDSDIVKAKRVKESPFQMECVLNRMLSIGEGGGSANLAICEIVKFHVAEHIFQNGVIHPKQIDLVGRMSADFYCRANGEAIFKVQKPQSRNSLGYDNLPQFIKDSKVYSANNLGRFAVVEQMPSGEDVESLINEILSAEFPGIEYSEEAYNRYRDENNYRYMLKCALETKTNNLRKKELLELAAKSALENSDIFFAWKTALLAGRY